MGIILDTFHLPSSIKNGTVRNEERIVVKSSDRYYCASKAYTYLCMIGINVCSVLSETTIRKHSFV
jgi:hypothetical protein